MIFARKTKLLNIVYGNSRQYVGISTESIYVCTACGRLSGKSDHSDLSDYKFHIHSHSLQTFLVAVVKI
jgi:hypothetical protein